MEGATSKTARARVRGTQRWRSTRGQKEIKSTLRACNTKSGVQIATAIYRARVHMRLVNVFKRYCTVILVVSIRSVWRTIDKLVTQDL